ncbi:O-antigen ligase family protein [Aestuariibaculum suncheonense]|uniref:O-antigen ligase family protein n=1 Tax=Aestuariibaculum suncheonense TaxID=1028745 RepID=A0A8J6Q159_9FLAO|nr:O-antigen ligase family protein [Aestuariibaculum suncheonense]MBD0833813.1 O-antigen ligase family protein [Aestuariibaculum suncheonense]
MSLVKKNILNIKIELLVGLLFISILFNNIISPIIVFLLCLIIFLDKKNYVFRLSYKNSIVCLFFGYLLIRESFSSDIKGWSYLFRLLPILIFIFTVGLYKFSKNEEKRIALLLIIINYFFYVLTFVVILFVHYDNYKRGVKLDFSYYQWIVPIKIGIHPPYWGFFINLSLITIINENKIRKAVKLIFCFVSFLFLLFLSSRVALFVFFGVVLIELVLNNQITIKTRLFVFVLLSVIGVFIGSQSSYLLKKMKNNEGVSNRLKLWEASIEAVNENYLFGNSIPEGRFLIKYFYEKNNKIIKDNYDPHNQFLSFTVNYGIIGLILFAGFLLYHERLNILYFEFLFIIFISFLTESILNRQMGVILFAFFLSYFSNNNTYKLLK